jgi:hypothetical protein
MATLTQVTHPHERTMKIRFETTSDDLIAFNRFHIENSPSMRRQRLIYQLLITALLGLVGLLALVASWKVALRNPVEFAVVASVAGVLGVAASIGWFFFARWYWMGLVQRNVRKLYSEGSNRGVLGWREMELVGGRLLLKMELIESKIDLRAIDKIVGNEEFTFVYIGSAQAYLIPMNLYPEDEYRQFVAELRDAWENRNVPAPEEAATGRRDERIVERPR